MTHNENRPGAVNTEAVAEVRPELAPSVEAVPDLATALAANRITLAEIRLRWPWAFALYVLGYDHGLGSRNNEVDELRAEAERLAFHAFDPGRQQRTIDDLLERERVQRFRKGAA